MNYRNELSEPLTDFFLSNFQKSLYAIILLWQPILLVWTLLLTSGVSFWTYVASTNAFVPETCSSALQCCHLLVFWQVFGHVCHQQHCASLAASSTNLDVVGWFLQQSLHSLYIHDLLDTSHMVFSSLWSPTMFCLLSASTLSTFHTAISGTHEVYINISDARTLYLKWFKSCKGCSTYFHVLVLFLEYFV